MRVKRWITMHGLSLNVHPNLAHFTHIVPCGIEDHPVGACKGFGRCQDYAGVAECCMFYSESGLKYTAEKEG